jgi:NAD(P)-dependent dehydrogenase (short-subunit alcohol dehydrogenase family)
MSVFKKRIIVTGGTYGIGASVVKALVVAEASVASMARSADRGRTQAAELTAQGPGTVTFYPCDVSQRSDVEVAFAAAAKDMGGLDALVHVAGIESSESPEDETDDEWDRIFSVNAKGTFITNQEAFRLLREDGGSIINFGAGGGIVGMAVGGAYSASKGAVVAWTRSIAQAWGRYNIRANCICPAVWTPMYEAHRSRYTPEALEQHDAAMSQIILMGGKLGDPDRDLAPSVVFLCSDDAHFITGQTICIDGGAVMVR